MDIEALKHAMKNEEKLIYMSSLSLTNYLQWDMTIKIEMTINVSFKSKDQNTVKSLNELGFPTMIDFMQYFSNRCEKYKYKLDNITFFNSNTGWEFKFDLIAEQSNPIIKNLNNFGKMAEEIQNQFC